MLSVGSTSFGVTKIDSNFSAKAEFTEKGANTNAKFTLTARGLDYVFQSNDDVRFFYVKDFKTLDTQTGLSVQDRIDILVHPQSIIHSMVEFNDTSIKAQLGFPDMKIPINYALHYPKHTKLNLNPLNLDLIGELTFEKPDLNKFQCIQLAYDAMESGGTSPAILNIANDLSVELFLNEKIKFNYISKLIELCITNHDYISEPSIDDIFAQIDWVKNHINKSTFIS